MFYFVCLINISISHPFILFHFKPLQQAMDKSPTLKPCRYLFLFISLSIKSSVQNNLILNENDFKCVYKIVNSTSSFEKSKNIMPHVSVNIGTMNNIYSALNKSSRCLITTSLRDVKLLNSLSVVRRHVILLEDMSCGDVPASAFNTEMYCRENGETWEKYEVRGKIVMNMVSKGDTSLVMLGREKLRRRSNLNGVEFKDTALENLIRTKDVKYGNSSESRISGVLGDFLMVLSKTLNFKFGLHKPADGKWGGREKSRKLGWNGMIGDIAEGLAEFGIGAFTISAARSEVVQFSIGNLEYVKTFFLSTNTEKTLNYSLFVNPLSIDSYLAVILIMIISALSLFFII
jgi:hypothetical protein